MGLQDIQRRRDSAAAMTAEDLWQLRRLLEQAHDLAWNTDIPVGRLDCLTDARDLAGDLADIVDAGGTT